MHHLLAYLGETCILGQIRYVSVHLAIHFNILHHLLAISLEAAIKVVQVLDSRYFASCGIEEFRGQGLRQGIVALLLVPRHEIIALFHNHTV